MNILIIVLLLLIAAEASYLVTIQNRKQIRGGGSHPVFVDTSVLIDGRIIAVAQSGFITSTLMIPRSVLGELQFLADHGDSDKRARARYGLDVANDLRELDTVKTEIFQDTTRAEDGVDNQLLKLAKQYNGSICTIDYNLNKVATVEGVKVLNVNDLAMSLRMAYLPGEKIMLELTSKGHDSHQAVGHLADGTMVVVEQASSMVGKTVEVEFIRSLQTAAGKMMFARPVVAAKRAAKVERTADAKRQASAFTHAEKVVEEQPKKPSATKAAPRGRQPLAPEKAEQQPKTNQRQRQQKAPRPANDQPKEHQQPRKNNNQRRRKNHEDSLINLVNQQED